MKKKLVMAVMTVSLLFSMVACGKIDDSSSQKNIDAETDQNEKEVSDKEEPNSSEINDIEVEVNQEEEKTVTSDAQPDTTEDENANNQQPDNNSAAPGYASASGFWNGNDFDLEGYLYANGAKWVKKGYDHADGTGFHESDTDITYYMAYFDTTYWMVTIGAGNIVFDYRGYKVDGETWSGPYYTAFQSTPGNEQTRIATNGITSNFCTDTLIETLDDMVFLSESYPDSDNPFQYSSLINHLYQIDAKHTDIPAGATHR